MRTAANASLPPIAAPLPEITTDRLDLRRFRPNDLDELAVVFEKREVWKFPYGRPFTREETSDFLDAQMREWDDCGFGCWVAREKASRRVIGYVGISSPIFLPEILPAVEVGSAIGSGCGSSGKSRSLPTHAEENWPP